MKRKVYSIYDAAIDAYTQPMCFLTHQEAVRSLSLSLQDPRSPFTQASDDYTLVCVGSWCDSSGKLESFDHPVRVCKVSELVTPVAGPMVLAESGCAEEATVGSA